MEYVYSGATVQFANDGRPLVPGEVISWEDEQSIGPDDRAKIEAGVLTEHDHAKETEAAAIEQSSTDEAEPEQPVRDDDGAETPVVENTEQPARRTRAGRRSTNDDKKGDS